MEGGEEGERERLEVCAFPPVKEIHPGHKWNMSLWFKVALGGRLPPRLELVLLKERSSRGWGHLLCAKFIAMTGKTHPSTALEAQD